MTRAAVLVAAALLGQAAAATVARAEAPCREVRLAVALAPSEPADSTVTGELCRPPGARTLQVLLSGGTYARVYWDLPSRPATNSYVRAAVAAGFATLALDRVGTGASDHPPAPALTVEAGAFVTHQVVAAARAGALGEPFARVVTVGHSLGSAIALVEAARHRDVDALVLSGFLAHARPVGALELVAGLVPAQLEPRLAGRPLGYLTTRAGARDDLFYYTPGADPRVIAIDERTKDTVSPFELATVNGASAPAVDAAIRVPVLSVVGEFDNVFCSASCARAGSPAFAEHAHYGNAPSFTTVVVPAAGHVLSLHRSAPRWFAVAGAWLRRVTGPPSEGASG